MGKKIKTFGRAALALGGNMKKITLGALLVSSLSINSSYAVPSGDLGGDKKSAEHKVKFASEDIDRDLLRAMAFNYERIPALVCRLSTKTIKGDLLPQNLDCDPKFLLLLYKNGVTVTLPSKCTGFINSHNTSINFHNNYGYNMEEIMYNDKEMLDRILTLELKVEDKNFIKSIKESEEFLVIQCYHGRAFVVVAENGRVYIDPKVNRNVSFIKSLAEKAIEEDDLEEFKRLCVNHQIEPNQKIKSPNDLYGYVEIPIILFCIEKGAEKCLNLLCEENVNLLFQEVSTNFGKADGMAMAATTGNTEIMELMKGQGKKIDEAVIKGAAKFCQEGSLKWILKNYSERAYMAYINECSFYAAIASNNCQGFIMLFSKGLDINSKAKLHLCEVENNSYGMAKLLRCAAGNNSYGMAKLLIELGADVNAKIENETPLVRAVENNSLEIVRLLVEKGADIYAKNRFGEMPLSVAVENDSCEMVKLLVEAGVDVRARSYVLFLAVRNNSLKMVRLLVEKGANIKVRNKNSKMPLHLACELRFSEIHQFLLSEWKK